MYYGILTDKVDAETGKYWMLSYKLMFFNELGITPIRADSYEAIYVDPW